LVGPVAAVQYTCLKTSEGQLHGSGDYSSISFGLTHPGGPDSLSDHYTRNVK